MKSANFGIKISGDSSGGVSAIGATREELKKLKKGVDNYSKSSGKADKGNRRLNKSMRSSAKETNGLALSFSNLLAPVAAVVSVSAGLQKLVSVTREFNVLNAQLVTATGSAKNADVAFQAIKEFATSTPYDLQQTTKAFTQLVNLGLTPSEEALTSYGDTASAMGKDLSQLVEAVADATTGEFERLKEFGIKSKSEGDNVAFTFRGITTTVKKNAEEIEGYLIGLGQNNFAGAMANRMATLDGQISNLGDSWDSLFLMISKQDTGGLMSNSVGMATNAIQELEAMIASGQLQAGIEAISSKFGGFGEDVAYSLDIVSQLLNDAYKNWIGGSESFSQSLTDSFSDMPENIRAFIQIMTVEVANFVSVSQAYGTEIAENLQFWKTETFDLDARLKILEQAKVDSVGYILEERNEAVASFDNQIEKAESLRVKYNELQAARASSSAGVDDFAQFAIDKPAANDDPQSPSGGGGEEVKDSYVLEALQNETAQIESELQLRRQGQAEHYTALYNQYGTHSGRELALLQNSIDQQKEQSRLAFEEELAALTLKNEMMLDSTSIDQDQKIFRQAQYLQQMQLLSENHNLNLNDIEQRGAATRAQIAEQERQAKTSAYTGLANAALGIAAAFGKKSAKQQKRLAIFETGISIIAGAAKALNNPYPANLVFAATVLAKGAALKSKLDSISEQSSAAPSISLGGGSAYAGGSSSNLPKAAAQSQLNKENERPNATNYVIINAESENSPIPAHILKDALKDTGVIVEIHKQTEYAKRVGAIEAA